MNSQKKRNNLTILLLLVFCSLQAQLGIQGMHYTVEEGLPDNWVNAAMLDKDGYMWFGTAYGLSRFDGEHFTNYYENHEDPFALSSLFFRDILQQDDGTIWLATLGGGLNHLDPSKATFEDFPTNSVLFDSDIPLNINDIEIIGDTLWFGCFHDGFGAFDLKNKRFCAQYDLPASPQFKDSRFDGNSVWQIIPSKKEPGILWIAAKNRGLIRFEIATGKQEVFPILDYFNQPGVVCAFGVLEDKDGLVWVATYGRGMVCFDPKTAKMKNYIYSDFADKHKVQATNWVVSVLEKSDTELWVATGDSGFGIFDKIKKTYRFFKSESIGENPALRNEVEKVYLDKENRLWVLGKKDGIRKFDLNRQPIQYYSLPSTNCNFEEQYVSDFSFAPSSQILYIATRSCGVFKQNLKTKQTTKVKIEGNVIPNFLTILVDSKQGVWAGSGKYGFGKSSLYYAKNEKEALKPITFPSASFFNQTINTLFEDSRGTIWIATDGSGLFSYHPSTRITTNISQRLNLPFWYEYLDVNENIEGEIYFALRNGGLVIIDSTYTSYKQFKEPVLKMGRVNGVVFNKKDEYWLALGNLGLCRIDVKKERPTQETVSFDGLTISKIIKDPNQELWLASENGLGHYSPQSGEFEMLSKSEGLRDPYLVGFGFEEIPNYGLAIGQRNGFALMVYSPKKQGMLTDKMSVTDFKIFDKSVFYEKNVLASKEIVLNHDQNMLTFRIGRLNYLDNRHMSFLYRLEGLEDTWIKPDQVPIITYSKLEPGHYTLLLRPIDSKGTITGEETRLKIFIQPAWWQTWWFRLSAIMVVIASSIGLTAYYVRFSQQIKFAELEKHREVERVRTRIAQDIHDDVGAQLTRMSLLAELAAMLKDQDSSLLLGKLRKIGQESRSAAANLREVVFAINPQSDTFEDLQAYLQDASNRFLEGTNLELSSYFPKPEENTVVTPDIKRQVSMVLRESLNNTIKHAAASHISICFEMKDSNQYRLIVKDNGKGFDAKAFEGVSHGLSGMKKRAKEVQAEIEIESSSESGTKIVMKGKLH